MTIQIESTAVLARAIANENRIQILLWLADPTSNFPPQVDGDLVKDGVCVGYITEKIGLSQPTVTAHLRSLEAAGFVSSRRIKNWVFFRLRAERLREFGGIFSELCDVAVENIEPQVKL